MQAVPNMLSALRLLLAALFPFVPPGWRLAAVIVGGVSDGVDGIVARRFSATSATGAILDAVADKAFVFSVLVTLAVTEEIAWWQAAPVVARDVSVACAAAYTALRGRWIDFRRMAPRMAGKLTTLFVFAWFVLVLAEAPDLMVQIAFAVAALASLWAAFDYLFQFVRAVRADSPQSVERGKW